MSHTSRVFARLTLTTLAAALCGWLGCATVSTEAQERTLKGQARFDLNCDAVTIASIAPNTFGVQGCGKRATYVCEDVHDPPMCILSKSSETLADPAPAQEEPSGAAAGDSAATDDSATGDAP